jgi:DNA repair exonuclease SbcCD ATPase subunit
VPTSLLTQLTSSASRSNREYLSAKAAIDAQRDHIKKLQDQVKKISEEISLEKEAHQLLLAVSDYILKHDPIQSMETIVGDILRKLIFPHLISFNIKTVEKRNQLETYFTATMNYSAGPTEVPIDSGMPGGGGDIAFMLIRLILLVNHPTKPRRILFADEPMKNLSHDRREAFLALIRLILEEFDMQLIMSTHETQYIENADLRYQFVLKGDETSAEKT